MYVIMDNLDHIQNGRNETARNNNKYKIPISINCVCRNEENILESAIDSVAPYVEEIIFVDHYSFDNTLAIAKILEQRYDNFKIIDKKYTDQNNEIKIMNYTEVRELSRMNSKCEIVMKYDGDFILVDRELLDKYVNILNNDKKSIGISFSVSDLFRDTAHIIYRKGFEPYIFKRDAINFYNDGRYADSYKIINKGPILKQLVSPVIHINNVKPALNILFRIRMTEYFIKKTNFDGNYFEWLYFIGNNCLPSREQLVEFIINNLRVECTHRLDSESNANQIEDNPRDIINFLHNTEISKIEIVKKNDGYYYNKTILLQYKNKTYYYPEDLNSLEFKNVLFKMYDDKMFDNFK